MPSTKKRAVGQADDKLAVVLKRLEQSKLRALDTETSGLDFRRCHIVGYVLTFSPDPKGSYYIPFRHAGGGNVGGRKGPQDPHDWDGKLAPGEQELLDAIDRQGVTNFGHNLNFDLRFLWRVGVTDFQARYEDTIINQPLLNEWQGRFSLEACANIAGVFAKKSAIINQHIATLFPQLCSVDGRGDNAPMAHYFRLSGDDPVAVEYAEGDGTSTWQLRDWQMKQIEEQNLGLVHDVESRLIPILARMSAFGIKVDEGKLDEQIDHVGKEIERLSNEFPSGFNARSPNDVKAWCESHGNKDWPMTAGRERKITKDDIEAGLAPYNYELIGTKRRFPQPSFPEAWLKTHEAGQKVVAVRKFETLRDTFLLPLKNTHLYKGRVHATFNQLRGDDHGTVTGRLSCSDPNLQASTVHNQEIGAIHRSVFVADDGMLWKKADYSQIEPRLMAYYTRCKVLMEGYLADPPIDAHTSVSIAANRNWDSLTTDEKKAYRNNFGKRINQTVITGGGRGVLVSKYGVPEGEVDAMLKQYHQAIPELKPFQKKASNRFRTRGYMLSLLGRRARLLDRDKDYTALNRLLQCGNADIIKLKMVQLGEHLQSIGRPVEMINNIHDDICFQHLPEHEPEFLECIEIMKDFGPSQPIELDVPMDVDVGSGKSWGEATYEH